MSKCECCRQVIRASRTPKQGQTKALRDDLTKAQSAIDVLTQEIANPSTFWRKDEEAIPQLKPYIFNTAINTHIEACQLEQARMQRALVEPRLLWSIYRRASKKPMEVVYGLS